jgi:hypothetical protein
MCGIGTWSQSCHQELSKRTIRSRSLLTQGQFVINYFDLPHNQSDERIRLPRIFLQIFFTFYKDTKLAGLFWLLLSYFILDICIHAWISSVYKPTRPKSFYCSFITIAYGMNALYTFMYFPQQSNIYFIIFIGKFTVSNWRGLGTPQLRGSQGLFCCSVALLPFQKKYIEGGGPRDPLAEHNNSD